MGFTLQSFPLRCSISFFSNSITIKGSIMLQLPVVSMRKPIMIPLVPAIYTNIQRCRSTWPGTSTGIIPMAPNSPQDSEKPGRFMSSIQNPLIPLSLGESNHIRKHRWLHEIPLISYNTYGSSDLREYPKIFLSDAGDQFRDDTVSPISPLNSEKLGRFMNSIQNPLIPLSLGESADIRRHR